MAGALLFIFATVGGVLLGRRIAMRQMVRVVEKPAVLPPPPPEPEAVKEVREPPPAEEQKLIDLAKGDPRYSQLFADVLIRSALEQELEDPGTFEKEIDRLAVLMQRGFFTIEEARKVSMKAALLLQTRLKQLGIGIVELG